MHFGSPASAAPATRRWIAGLARLGLGRLAMEGLTCSEDCRFFTKNSGLPGLAMRRTLFMYFHGDSVLNDHVFCNLWALVSSYCYILLPCDLFRLGGDWLYHVFESVVPLAVGWVFLLVKVTFKSWSDVTLQDWRASRLAQFSQARGLYIVFLVSLRVSSIHLMLHDAVRSQDWVDLEARSFMLCYNQWGLSISAWQQ